MHKCLTNLLSIILIGISVLSKMLAIFKHLQLRNKSKTLCYFTFYKVTFYFLLIKLKVKVDKDN